MAKYTLLEFIAANESEDFNKIDDGMMEFAKQILEGFNHHALNVGTHGGDCTKMPAPCLLCTYEQILSDYREYYFGRIERIEDVERYKVSIDGISSKKEFIILSVLGTIMALGFIYLLYILNNSNLWHK